MVIVGWARKLRTILCATRHSIQFFCQVVNTRGSHCFSSSLVFLPASLLVTLVFRWRICQPVADTKASTPHARKKPSDTQGSFQVGEKAFFLLSNFFCSTVIWWATFWHFVYGLFSNFPQLLKFWWESRMTHNVICGQLVLLHIYCKFYCFISV